MQETCQGHFESPVLSNSLSTFVKEERHNPRTSSCHEKCAMVEFGLRQRQLEPISQKVVPPSEGGELNYLSPKEQTGFISVKLTTLNQALFGGFPSDSGGNALFLLRCSELRAMSGASPRIFSCITLWILLSSSISVCLLSTGNIITLLVSAVISSMR